MEYRAMISLRAFVTALGQAFFLAGCGGTVVQTGLGPAEKAYHERFDGAVMQYYLSRGELKASAAYDNKTLSVSIERQITAYPDFTLGPLTLSYQHAQLSTDEVTVQLEGGALLKKVSSTTTDQTVAAVQALNALLGQAGSLQTALAKSKSAKQIGGADATCGSIKVSRIVDVTYETQANDTFEEKGDAVCDIKLDAKVYSRGEAIVAGFPRNEKEIGCRGKECWNICSDAVCFRTTGSYSIKVTAKLVSKGTDRPRPEVDKPMEIWVDVVAPHKTRMSFVRFNRRLFVTNTTSVSFDKGMMSEFTVKDPSEFVGFLQLPTEVLKGVVLTVPLVK
jgi:hypothetical protein